MKAELIAKMRGRIDQCRNLAKWINDPAAAKILEGMANEGEADLERLEAEEAQHGRPAKAHIGSDKINVRLVGARDCRVL